MDKTHAADALTCSTCMCVFELVEQQRHHFQSDYHRLNLNRRLANLKPVDEATYEKKAAEIKLKEEIALKGKGAAGHFSAQCTACRKNFSSEGALRQHEASKKHKNACKGMRRDEAITISPVDGSQRAEKTEKSLSVDEREPQVVAETDDDKPPPTDEELIEEKLARGSAIDITECVGCGHKFKSVAKCTSHAVKEHGLFIPDVEYLVDLEGLLRYLGEKIGIGNCCLYCDKIFDSVEAVRGHMRDRGHAKLRYDEDDNDEFDDFYDFSSTYEGLEGIEELEDVQQYAKSRIDISDDGVFLLLKDSNKMIGHRAFKRYFDQRIPTVGTVLARRTAHEKIIQQYKKRGLSLTTMTPARLAHKRAIHSQQKHYQKTNLKFGINGNKNKQHHFVRKDLCW